jgi:hypothetical protein
MADDRFRAGVQPGDGVVARYGAVALVVAPGGDAFTDALVRLVSVAYDDPRSLVWQVTGLVAAHQPGVPAFALAIGGPQSRRVLVHGSARAVVDGEEIDGAGMWTWCERVFGAHGRLTLTVAAGAVTAAPRSDLRDGVLGGSGLVLEPEPVFPAAAPPGPGRPAAPTPAPVAPPVEAPQPSPLGSAGRSVFAPLPTPSPTPTPAPAPRAAIVTPPPPTADEVSTAFRAIPSETVHIADAIAALQADNGSRVPLDRDYVFGRNPQQDPAVVRGASSPVKVDDGAQLISRIHTRVSVAGGTVTVRDAGSANGTFIAAPGDAQWTRIGPEPVPLPVGHSLRLGLRVYTHVPADY